MSMKRFFLIKLCYVEVNLKVQHATGAVIL